ncbi:hypothetical protein MKK69_13065 [Methylobacterium sp. J-026]|uniref:hypothetical protein n=1 Tax=Methylobacterium sp. J-026 TaxID=2836624 RepID=UPI001FBA3DE1|nr:hypothetical protein [Methylobacterium sp. J-026]MCJ2134976.1 hypothetical protein [Methylobacterium sp. J-026]
MTNPASDLRDLAAWAGYCAEWIGESVGAPNGGRTHATRTISFEAATFDDFLIGLRRLGPELDRLAQVVERPRLRLVSGGRA